MEARLEEEEENILEDPAARCSGYFSADHIVMAMKPKDPLELKIMCTTRVCSELSKVVS